MKIVNLAAVQRAPGRGIDLAEERIDTRRPIQ